MGNSGNKSPKIPAKVQSPKQSVTMDQGISNLRAMFERADEIDLAEGQVSYRRYNQIMGDLSRLFCTPLDRVIAAFCALSPNNDYSNNLRSLVSLLHGIAQGWPLDDIECSTYRHCLLRAYDYVTGKASFLHTVEGRKIRSFYHNILDPSDPRFVTVDGHICAAWRGQRLTMKEAIVKGQREYDQIEAAVMALACRARLLPNQYQAILWFTRKRVFQIKAELHLDMFLPNDDVWKTYRDVTLIKPFPRRRVQWDAEPKRATKRGRSGASGPSGLGPLFER